MITKLSTNYLLEDNNIMKFRKLLLKIQKYSISISIIYSIKVSKLKENDESYFPGNLGFDSLGLYPKDEDDQRKMQLAEIKHGRVAMIAVVRFALQEFIFKVGVVDETPSFFFPLWNLMN